MTPLLITIAASHYCEKARWGLQAAGIPFVEEAHPPMLHYAATFPRGARRTVPVLLADGKVFPDSTDILKWVDRQPGIKLRLYPQDAAACAKVDQWEELFDVDLGPATRRMVYLYLLPRPDISVPVLTSGVGPVEKKLFELLYPFISKAMKNGMRVDVAGAERSRAKVEDVFGKVAASLEDGRPWLGGDAFTAADLTFASLAAPLLDPPGHGCPLPAGLNIPPEMLKERDAWRAHPAGAFALRVYAQRRWEGAAA